MKGAKMADLIDRRAAIDEILRLSKHDTVRDLYETTVADKDDYKLGIIDAIDAIVALPGWNYRPNCGARMEENDD